MRPFRASIWAISQCLCGFAGFGYVRNSARFEPWLSARRLVRLAVGRLSSEVRRVRSMSSCVRLAAAVPYGCESRGIAAAATHDQLARLATVYFRREFALPQRGLVLYPQVRALWDLKRSARVDAQRVATRACRCRVRRSLGSPESACWASSLRGIPGVVIRGGAPYETRANQSPPGDRMPRLAGFSGLSA